MTEKTCHGGRGDARHATGCPGMGGASYRMSHVRAPNKGVEPGGCLYGTTAANTGWLVRLVKKRGRVCLYAVCNWSVFACTSTALRTGCGSRTRRTRFCRPLPTRLEYPAWYPAHWFDCTMQLCTVALTKRANHMYVSLGPGCY